MAANSAAPHCDLQACYNLNITTKYARFGKPT